MKYWFGLTFFVFLLDAPVFAQEGTPQEQDIDEGEDEDEDEEDPEVDPETQEASSNIKSTTENESR